MCEFVNVAIWNDLNFIILYNTQYFINNNNVTSTVFESKDEPTLMTKQSFTIIYFITYKKTIHFKLICKHVHSCRQYFSNTWIQFSNPKLN